MQKVMPMKVDAIALPNMPTKKELADFFQYAKTESLYTSIITQEILDLANDRIGITIYRMDFIRSERCKRIPPGLARVIYEVHGVAA